jgi:N-acyl-D-amino-acid deacylase
MLLLILPRLERLYNFSSSFVDLVLLNPDTVIDKATITDSKALSEGILRVWVNGKLVYTDKKVTGERPGEFLGK